MPSRTPVCPIRSRRCSWIHLNYTITCRSRQSCQLPLCDDKSRRSTHPHPRRPLRMALRNIQTRLTCPRLPHLYWHSRSHSRKLLEFQLFHSRSHITISARAHQQVQAWAMPSSLTSVPLMASHLSSRPLLRWCRGYARWRRSQPSPWYGHHPDGAQAQGYWLGWKGVR